MKIVFQFAINFPEAFFRCLVPFRPNRSIHCIRIVTHFKCHLLRHGSRKRYVWYLPHYAPRSSAYCICALCAFFPPRFFVLIFPLASSHCSFILFVYCIYLPIWKRNYYSDCRMVENGWKETKQQQQQTRRSQGLLWGLTNQHANKKKFFTNAYTFSHANGMTNKIAF